MLKAAGWVITECVPKASKRATLARKQLREKQRRDGRPLPADRRPPALQPALQFIRGARARALLADGRSRRMAEAGLRRAGKGAALCAAPTRHTAAAAVRQLRCWRRPKDRRTHKRDAATHPPSTLLPSPKRHQAAKTVMLRSPGLEPGPGPWQGPIIPLDYERLGLERLSDPGGGLVAVLLVINAQQRPMGVCNRPQGFVKNNQPRGD